MAELSAYFVDGDRLLGLEAMTVRGAVVLWLCSPGASCVIGHALTVDGGMTVV